MAREQTDEERQRCRHRKRDPRKAAHDLLHTVELAGSQILAHHGAARRIHGVGNQVDDVGDLIGNTGKGRNLHAVGVDPGVDEQLGDLD